MGDGGRWKERFRQRLGSVAEPVPGMPLVEIAGQNRVLIENHRGICCYGPEQVRVRVTFGAICVAGSGLSLCRMSRETVVIVGHIHSVELHREAKS